MKILEAVKSIGPLKAPGPDGLHAIFYQKHWEEVKQVMIPLIKNFFMNNFDLKDLNHTNIALIPKVERPVLVSHFRPISLCNVSYKIITKIIVKRLRILLEKCISKNQGAFAPGRVIQDNILIAHELFSDFQRKKKSQGYMAVKLDLEKAYDFLNWRYIKACLTKFGFCDNWINMVLNCISSVSFSVIINGKPEGWFKPSRGIRQGDPLSPYIFILCMEPLIREFNKLADKPRNQVGIVSAPRGPRISNLVFADDCLIFAKATRRGARNILKTLSDFATASGQKINFHKSSLYFSPNVCGSRKNDIVNILGIQQKSTIGKYLGIHNVACWKDPINSKELILKISNKLAGWKKNTLSHAGRVTLIKTNLAGMPNHVMSCFNCDKRTTKAVDKESRSFLWGDSKNPPVAWEQVCTPKSIGGLGIRPSAYFNKAAVAKLGWKIIMDHSNWWVQIVKNKYLKNHSFFETKKKSSDSVAWKGILDSRDLITKGMRWTIGTGKEARNDASFRNISTSPLTIISVAASIEKSFKENNMNCRVGSFKTPSAIKWQPPPASTFKVNFDGSVTSSSAACGIIIRNSEGVPIITSSKNIGKASVPTTEATALRDSILIAKNRGLTRIIVEGDSKIIIDAVNGKISAPWRLQQIIEDIKTWLKSSRRLALTTSTGKQILQQTSQQVWDIQ
ncbi:hypothetical protein ACLB2K_055736 [Fragaria x ananassa]